MSVVLSAGGEGSIFSWSRPVTDEGVDRMRAAFESETIGNAGRSRRCERPVNRQRLRGLLIGWRNRSLIDPAPQDGDFGGGEGRPLEGIGGTFRPRRSRRRSAGFPRPYQARCTALRFRLSTRRRPCRAAACHAVASLVTVDAVLRQQRFDIADVFDRLRRAERGRHQKHGAVDVCANRARWGIGEARGSGGQTIANLYEVYPPVSDSAIRFSDATLNRRPHRHAAALLGRATWPILRILTIILKFLAGAVRFRE